MSTYNGWTNYATWRINLEIFDGLDFTEEDGYSITADGLRDLAEEIVFNGCENTLAESYARAFMSDVNWYEIAEHILEMYPNESEEESE
jgi:hypothetical protein